MSSHSPDHATEGKLLLLATEQNVHAFALSETFRVALGRHDSNDVQLRSRSVSNFHAEIMNWCYAIYGAPTAPSSTTIASGNGHSRVETPSVSETTW